MKILIILILFVVLLSVNIVAFPSIDYLSIKEKDKQEYQKIINSIPKKHFEGIIKIQLIGIERWKEWGWFTTDRVILIDKDGLSELKYVLPHELIHNKCYTKGYKWDLSHESECFLEGLN